MKTWFSEWQSGRTYAVSLGEELSLGPGFEPGSQALHAGELSTAPPRRNCLSDY